MDKCIVRRAVKEAKTEKIIGYEMVFQGGSDDLYTQTDNAAADTISEFFMNNSDKIFRDKQIFITLTPSLLFRNVAKFFDKEKVVIQIEENVIIHPLAMPIIKKYYNEGYKFAINNFKFNPNYLGFLEYVEYIHLSVKESLTFQEIKSMENIVNMARSFNKKSIAVDIDSKTAYNFAIAMGFDYLEGSYISETLTEKADKVDFMEGNFFQLVAAVAKDEPDMAEIEMIVSRDAGLTYAILKIVNSAYFALRRRTSSIRQALVTLGINQLRQWVYMLSFQYNGTDGSEEMLKLAFLRATFAQDLAMYIVNAPLSKMDAYMMGMFSTLDLMIDAELEEILEDIPLSEDIKTALITEEGDAGKLIQLVLAYERADWKKCQELAEEFEVNNSILSQTYINCVEEVNRIWESIMTEFPRPDEDMSYYIPEDNKNHLEDVLY